MKVTRREMIVLLASAAVTSVVRSTAFAHDTFAHDKDAMTDFKGPARNPFLAADIYAVGHFDPAQSDVIPYPAPQGTFHIDLQTTPRVWRGPINILTAASTSPDHMWGFSSEGVTYINVSKGRFREVARATAPGVKVISPEALHEVLEQRFTNVAQIKEAVFNQWGLDWTRLGNGVYPVVDRDNRAYYNTFAGQVVIFALKDPRNPSAGIEIVGSRDFREGVLREQENIVALNMTYDGQLIVAGTNSISVVNRNLKGAISTVRLSPDENILNAVAVDERNGIYFASDKIMRKLVWTGSELSEAEAKGAWAAPYDQGRLPPSVKFSTGTGSTPTLMGFGDNPDKLVVITDGADRMKLVAFWRDEIPKGWKQLPGTQSARIAGQIQVTCGLSPLPEFIQSEQSVVVYGYGAFVVNNIRPQGAEDRLADVIAGGPVFEPPAGVERFEWDPQTHAWKSVWTRDDVVDTSMVPALSAPSGIVFVNGYTSEDGWEVTGMDWTTGETVHRTIFGQGNLGNGAYAMIQFFPNGDLLFNSIGGPTRVKLARRKDRSKRHRW